MDYFIGFVLGFLTFPILFSLLSILLVKETQQDLDNWL